MKNKIMDSIIAGFIPGIILPALFLTLIILLRKNDYNFLDYITILYKVNAMPKLISICLIPNLLLFFAFIWTNHLKSARGVLLSMFVAGLVIGLMKLM